MTAHDCKSWEGCNVPICPRDPEEIISRVIWYPDEDICRIRKNVPKWIKQQRKIANKAKTENHWYYFTLDMLKIPFRTTNSCKGLDPNKDEKIQMAAWQKTHKGIQPRKITEKQKQALAEGRASNAKKGDMR